LQVPNTFRGGPDERGHFGIYGGRFVAETLMPLVLAVEQAYAAAREDLGFQGELDYYLDHYVGRPSPLYFPERLTRYFGAGICSGCLAPAGGAWRWGVRAAGRTGWRARATG